LLFVAALDLTVWVCSRGRCYFLAITCSASSLLLFLCCIVYVGLFVARLSSSIKMIFGYFVFGSSCLADCITAGAGSECAVCNAKYAQTGNLLLSLACVLHDQLLRVCLLLCIFFFSNKLSFHS